MKLLFVHERFGALAGAEANLFHTAVELGRRGHTLGLLHGAGTGRAEAVWRSTFSDCFTLTAKDEAAATRTALRVFRPDLVYLHKLADLAVLEVLADSGVPVVRMVHDHEMYCPRGYKYHYLSREICTRPLSPYCLVPCGAFVTRNHGDGLPLQWNSYPAKKRELELNRQFHRFIVATDYMRQELLRNEFAEDKIEIHPPVTHADQDAVRSTFSPRNRIVYAGQIIRGKGVDVLLEALALVNMPFECLIFGDGSHRKYCEELSLRLGLDGHVHFKGYVPQDELEGAYREASLAVLSSVWAEPFGGAGLEGMRHGLPVVAFDAGGIKEWLLDWHNGFLVPWMDRDAFAARVEQLLSDKLLARQMGERGRHWAEQLFNFPKYITRLEEAFHRTLAGARHPVPA